MVDDSVAVLGPPILKMKGTGGDIDVVAFDPIGKCNWWWLYFRRLRLGYVVIRQRSLILSHADFGIIEPHRYPELVTKVDEWVDNGWSDLPPNVFIDYWLDRDLPDRVRDLLEKLTW